jgi:hypothetical protein
MADGVWFDIDKPVPAALVEQFPLFSRPHVEAGRIKYLAAELAHKKLHGQSYSVSPACLMAEIGRCLDRFADPKRSPTERLEWFCCCRLMVGSMYGRFREIEARHESGDPDGVMVSPEEAIAIIEKLSGKP